MFSGVGLSLTARRKWLVPGKDVASPRILDDSCTVYLCYNQDWLFLLAWRCYFGSIPPKCHRRYRRIMFRSMLSNCIPRGNKRVLMIGGDTKDLYYLPRDIDTATLVDPEAKESLWQQAAIQAGAPVAVRNRPYEDLRFAPDRSFGEPDKRAAWHRTFSRHHALGQTHATLGHSESNF